MLNVNDKVIVNGRCGVVILVDESDDGLPYAVRFNDKIDYDWCRSGEVELVSGASAPSPVEGVKRVIGADLGELAFRRYEGDDGVAIHFESGESVQVTIAQLREVMRLIDGDAA